MTTLIRLLAVFLFLSASAPLAARDSHYEAKISGMSCAYCAYNATRQLAAIRGVQRDSVHVDLESATARLSSHRTLTEDDVAQALAAAGFELASLRATAKPGARKGALHRIARLEVEHTSLDDEATRSLLQALGSVAAHRRGELRLWATDAEETRLAGALIRGKQVTVPVTFERSRRDTIVIECWAGK